MLIRRAALIILTVGFSFLLRQEPVWATVAGLQSLKAAYPGLDVKMYNCKVCHAGAVGKKGDLNLYGLALQKSKLPADAKKLTIEDLLAIGKEDSDKDGVLNGDEIKAGTSPGTEISPTDPMTPPKKGEKEKKESSKPRDQKTLENLLASLAHQIIPAVSAEETVEKQKAEYVGMETCASCHDKQYKEFQKSTHARINIPGETKAQGCETCHGPGSLHVEAGGGKGVGGIINPSKDPSTCFSCHSDKKLEFRLPHHHPVLEGKMSCSDCHSAHGTEVRPWSSTSMQDVNETCFKCHKDQRGPFVWEHEALREGCTTCHKVHGSIHDKMLIVRDSNLCLRCHTQVNYPTIGKSSHSSRLFQGTCFSAGCHTAPHGSNFDDHLRY